MLGSVAENYEPDGHMSPRLLHPAAPVVPSACACAPCARASRPCCAFSGDELLLPSGSHERVVAHRRHQRRDT
eukprot:2384746-Pyramimonas_sp.AAC.1